MDYREFSDKAIAKLAAEEPTYKNCEILSWMYTVRDHVHTHARESRHKLNETEAKNWTSSMENADGTHGAHWTMDKTEEVRKQFGINNDPVQWWVTMNMMYSDYCAVAEKLGVSNLEFFACMSQAFLNDKDAQSDKLSRYYEFIADHDHG